MNVSSTYLANASGTGGAEALLLVALGSEATDWAIADSCCGACACDGAGTGACATGSAAYMAGAAGSVAAIANGW